MMPVAQLLGGGSSYPSIRNKVCLSKAFLLFHVLLKIYNTLDYSIDKLHSMALRKNKLNYIQYLNECYTRFTKIEKKNTVLENV